MNEHVLRCSGQLRPFLWEARALQQSRPPRCSHFRSQTLRRLLGPAPQAYPERMAQLPPRVFQTLLSTLQFGVGATGDEEVTQVQGGGWGGRAGGNSLDSTGCSHPPTGKHTLMYVGLLAAGRCLLCHVLL